MKHEELLRRGVAARVVCAVRTIHLCLSSLCTWRTPQFRGVTHITPELAFQKENGQVIYFDEHMPVFIHGEKDVAADIARAFGVTEVSVKRAVALYRAHTGRGLRRMPGSRRNGWRLRSGAVDPSARNGRCRPRLAVSIAG